jgi:hypothetical protein
MFMPGGYPDFSWFVRAVSVLPIVTGAVIAGGVVGGFSVFALDRALAPSQGSDSATQATAVSLSKPIRVVGTPSAPVPNQVSTPKQDVVAASPTPVVAPTQTDASSPQVSNVAPPAAPKAWPDAMTRAHPQTDAAANSSPSQPVPTPMPPVAATNPAPDKSANNDNVQASPNLQTSSLQTSSPQTSSPQISGRQAQRRQAGVQTTETTSPVPVKPPRDRQRVVNVRPSQPNADDGNAEDDVSADDNGAAATEDVRPVLGRPVYNYYGGRPRYDRDGSRVIVRRGQPTSSDEASRPAPRPEPFWGSRDRDDRDDD